MKDFASLSDAELMAMYKTAKDPFEGALKAEGITGPVADIARSIYQQESGSGKNTKTSNAGAVGGMQIIPGTFKSVADKDWDINDPTQNARAGLRYVKQLYEQAGGDPALTAAGYYGGPGGLEKARRGVAVSDPRNPNAPTTLQYGQQVAARIPKKESGFSLMGTAQAGTLPPENSLSSLSDDELMAMYQKAKTPAEPPRVEVRGTSADEPKPQNELLRQLGLTARAGVKGVLALPAVVSDAATGVVNTGLDATLGKDNGFRFRTVASAADNLMTGAGLAQPRDATERVVQDITGAMAGAGGTVAAGKLMQAGAAPVVQKMGEMFAAGPGLQTASGVLSSGASGVTRENGGGATAQVIAGLGGALAPGLATSGAAEATRRVLRGGEAGRQRVNENIKLFNDTTGVSPSVGQATEGRGTRAVESILAKTPGGAGVMSRSAQEKSDAMAASVTKLADDLSPGGSAIKAGEAITSGVQGFKEGVKTVQKRLYDTLDQYIPPDTRIPSARTQTALADLNAEIAGAPELSKWFKNARIQGIEGGLKSDTTSLEAILSRPGVKNQADALRAKLTTEAQAVAAANAERSSLGMRSNLPKVPTQADIEGRVNSFLQGQADKNLPYEGIKKLRTLVGQELADNNFASDVPRSKWSALYAALSDDLGDAATSAGPKAAESWKWANQYTNSQLERLEQLSGIVGKDAPEKVFSAAMSGSAEGNTVLKRVVDAIPKENRKELASAVLRRMGRATNSNQNGIGDAFSTETFLTNLNKLSPDSRATLFGRLGVPDTENKLLEFAKVAANVREGSKVFANPSGTQAAVSAQTAGLAGLGGLMTGNLPVAAAAAGGPLAANYLARKMTDPNAVNWLGRRTEVPLGALTASGVNALARYRSD